MGKLLSDEEKDEVLANKVVNRKPLHDDELILAEVETGYLFCKKGDAIGKFRADTEHEDVLAANEDAKQIAANSTNGLPGDRRPARLGY